MAGKGFSALARLLAPPSVAIQLCQSGLKSQICNLSIIMFFIGLLCGLNETAVACHIVKIKKLLMSSFSPICRMVSFIQVFFQNVLSSFVWGLKNLIPVINGIFKLTNHYRTSIKFIKLCYVPWEI